MTKTKPQPLTITHQPVLLDAALSLLAPKSGEEFLDLTAGFGGHAAAILFRTKSPKKTVLVDRDASAAKFLKDRFSGQGATVLRTDFLSVSRELKEKGRHFDIILADLGVSSLHLDNTSRGFTFREPGPLDMRMDQSSPLSADEIVNRWSESSLADILSRYGEEPKAKAIAKAIRNARPILDTKQLALVVAKCGKSRRAKVHPATRVFQAIRIAVNDELSQLEESLPLWIEMLKPGGRLVVISFHSLEDRIVKQVFGDYSEGAYSSVLKLLTKKPITATQHELVINPRARSAKLRAAAKIKTKKGVT